MYKNIQFRVSVVGLFIDNHEVLLLHQTTPPEPDCWDLPGGGLEPGETLFAALKREIQEETGIEEFNVDKLLTVVEGFFPQPDDQLMHTLNIIYQCSLDSKPLTLVSNDPEIGPKGIQWLDISELTPENCSNRAWKALQTVNLVTC
jgi:ADP-ribose pyrophosphatase YjhB (NUDIX family)